VSVCLRGYSALRGVDNAQEICGFQGCSAHEGAVDVLLAQELLRVAWLHAAAVLNAHGIGNGITIEILDGGTDNTAHAVGFIGGADFARANGPHLFVSDHDLGHLFSGDTLKAILDLGGYNRVRVSGLALGQEFAARDDYIKAVRQRVARLRIHACVGIAKHLQLLRVSILYIT